MAEEPLPGEVDDTRSAGSDCESASAAEMGLELMANLLGRFHYRKPSSVYSN